MIEPNDLYRRIAQEGQELHDEIDRLRADLVVAQTAAKHWSDQMVTLVAERNALSARCTALEEQARDISVTLSDAGVNAMPIPEGVRSLIAKKDAEITRIESEKAAYRTLAEIDKASLVERDERISNLCGELAASRSEVQTNWDEGIEVIATHIEHLRDEFQSTAMPVKSVATAVRDRFASPFAEKLDLDYLKSQAVIADNVPRLLQDLARANKEIERLRLLASLTSRDRS